MLVNLIVRAGKRSIFYKAFNETIQRGQDTMFVFTVLKMLEKVNDEELQESPFIYSCKY